MKSWKQATEPKMDFAKVRCWAGLFSNLIYFSFKQSASEQHTATDLNGWFYFIFWPVLSDNNRLLQAVTGKQDYCLEKAYFRILVLCLTHCIIQLWKTVIQQKQVYDMQGFASRQTQDRYQRHEADKTLKLVQGKWNFHFHQLHPFYSLSTPAICPWVSEDSALHRSYHIPCKNM